MKKIMVLLVLGLVMLSVSFAQDRIEVGKEAIQKGEYLRAIEELREAVRKDKKNPQAYFWLGTAYLKADSAAQAEPMIIQARELDPNNVAIYDLLGDVYAKQNILPAAMEQYKRASEIDSTNKDIFLKLAETGRKARQYTEAGTAYKKVIMLDSTNLTALTELSKLYMRAKQYTNAVWSLEKLARLKPEDVEVQMSYIRALFEIKDYAKVKSVAEHIFTLKISDRERNEVDILLATANKNTGDLPGAIKSWEKMNPDSMSLENLIAYGKALRTTEKFEKGIDILERAFRKDSNSCEIPYELGSLYLKLKRWPDAVVMFEKKIVCDTSAGYQFACHLNAGMCLMQMKEFARAKDHIQKAIDIKPDNIQAWVLMAQNYAQLGDDANMVKCYQKVIELATIASGTNGNEGKFDTYLEEANMRIGVYLLVSKKYKESIEYLKKALSFDPKDCQLLLWIAQANQNSNNKEEAKKYYCKVLDNCPKSKQAQDAENGLNVLGLKCGG